MISALCWVPKGAAKRKPDRYVPSAEEVAMIKNMAAEEEELEAEDEEEEKHQGGSEGENNTDDAMQEEDDELPAELRMDEYDDEDGDIVNATAPDGIEESEDGPVDYNSDNESDQEDDEVRPNDALLLVARTEEDYSLLEVYLFEEETDTLYVHHDITLPAFPLSLAWMDCPPYTQRGEAVTGSYVAVGTFKPGIELWNLDVMDVFEPAATLGGDLDTELRDVATVPAATGGKKKRKKKRNRFEVSLKPGSHSDAVLTLDWNRDIRNLLASGSADSTVKVWDVTTQTAVHTFNHHKDKVQSVVWNPAEATVLASGSFDRSIAVLDGRSPDKVARISLNRDVECMAWNPVNPVQLAVSTEDGIVRGYDVRTMSSSPLYTLTAHSGACSSLSFSPGVSGMLATAGVDKQVKIWDVQDNSPICIASKGLSIGEIFSISFYEDSPFVLAAGGSKGMVAVWDTEENRGVQVRFSDRRKETASQEEEGQDVEELTGAEEEEEKAATSTGNEERKSKKKPKKKKK